MGTMHDEYAGRKLAEPTRCHLFEFAPQRYRTFGEDAKAVCRALNRPVYAVAGVATVDINDEPEGWLSRLLGAGLAVALYSIPTTGRTPMGETK